MRKLFKFNKLLFVFAFSIASLLLTTSVAKANSWSPREQISQVPNGGFGQPIHFSSDSAGTLHAIWLQSNSGPDYGYWYSQKTQTGPWISPERVPVPLPSDINVVTGNNGVVYVLGKSNNTLFYISRPDSGPWSDLEILITSIRGSPPSFAFGSDGTLHIVYSAQTVGIFLPNQMFYQYKQPGQNWSVPQEIAHGTGHATGGDLAIGPNGTLHLVWNQDMDGDFLSQNYDTFYSNLPFGSNNWTPFVKVLDNAQVASNHGFVVDDNSTAHLVFWDNSRGLRLVYSYLVLGNQWSEPIDISLGNARYPSLVVTVNDTLDLTFDNDDFTILSRTKNPGENWSNISTVTTYSTFLGGAFPTLILDPFGKKHLLYGDGQVYQIQQINQPPVASAGPNQTVVVNNQVQLDGSASSDPDSDPLTYLWAEDSANPQLGILSTNTDVNPAFTPQAAGAYTFSLVVNDGLVNSPADSVTITVQTPTQAIQSLIDLMETFNLQQGISNSLDSKLNAALGVLDDINQNNNGAAINSLQSFINSVEAQRGNKITSQQADELIAAAQTIINSLLAS